MKIDATNMHFQALNNEVRMCKDAEITIDGCIGQRYIAAGLSAKQITINGTPGNALAAYLDGCTITVNGNAQDAACDTMNHGRVIIHGSAGDAAGYAMRGGEIYVRDNVGYRAGIHMKAYQDKAPVLVVGGSAGSFLGEYQAGGSIIVLGLNSEGRPPMGYFCGTGMHGGRIYLRCTQTPVGLPPQVVAKQATAQEISDIQEHVENYCGYFGADAQQILNSTYYILRPDTKNPYKQLYTLN